MNLPPTYCFWSVATGPYAELMERCVASARAAGVFKPFHVMTDQPIAGAESYEAYEVEQTDKLFKLVYLKAAISKLNFDYYVWVDADTIFRHNPRNLLACLSRSPIHVPLEVNLSALLGNSEGARAAAGPNSIDEAIDVDAPQPKLYGMSIRDYTQLFTAAGVHNPVYWSRSAFWIVRRTAVERVCELALHFRAFAKERGVTVDATAGLSYAMQMLCADPEKHELVKRPDLWASAANRAASMTASTVKHTCPFTGLTEHTGPAILHESRSEQDEGNLNVETTQIGSHELVSAK